MLRELMEYMGHSSLQATERHVKLLPQPAGPDGAADRLDAYLGGRMSGARGSGRPLQARCNHLHGAERLVAARCG